MRRAVPSPATCQAAFIAAVAFLELGDARVDLVGRRVEPNGRRRRECDQAEGDPEEQGMFCEHGTASRLDLEIDDATNPQGAKRLRTRGNA